MSSMPKGHTAHEWQSCIPPRQADSRESSPNRVLPTQEVRSFQVSAFFLLVRRAGRVPHIHSKVPLRYPYGHRHFFLAAKARKRTPYPALNKSSICRHVLIWSWCLLFQNQIVTALNQNQCALLKQADR
jgi:hypothetical protein